MRVLDLGCGQGRELASWGVTEEDQVTGVDIKFDRLALAREKFPCRHYLQSAGESLPFANESFDRVLCLVSLPYMNIPGALAEIERVMVPGGSLLLSLHLPGFTLSEFAHNAFPRPMPMLYRLYVAANGCIFHCTGRAVKFINGRTESFQTERGMTMALRRAGFITPLFRRTSGARGESFLAEATKPAKQPLGLVTRIPSGTPDLRPYGSKSA